MVLSSQPLLAEETRFHTRYISIHDFFLPNIQKTENATCYIDIYIYIYAHGPNSVPTPKNVNI